MKLNLYLSFTYLILYFSFVILGPDYIYPPIFKRIEIISKKNDLKRFVFSTYISFLFISYYFYRPNLTNFINCVIFGLLSLIAYVIYKKDLRGIIYHVIYLIPPLIYGLFLGKHFEEKYNYDIRLVLIIFYYLLIYKLKRKIYKVIK